MPNLEKRAPGPLGNYIAQSPFELSAMSGFKRVLRKKRVWMIVLLLAFLVLDVALIGYTLYFTTDSKQGELVQSGLVVSEADTSAFGDTVILAEGSLYMYAPTGLVKFQGSDHLTSYSFAYLSEAVAVVTDKRVLDFYPRGTVVPAFSKVMDSDTTVICIREQASGNEYFPVDIAVVSSNQTGSYFIPISLNGGGTPGIASLLPGSMVSQASARSGSYATIACDDGSLLTFRIGRDGPVSTIPDEGQVVDMVMVDNGMKAFVLHQDGSVLALKPANGFVYEWTNLSDSVKSLVLGEDGASVFALEGDSLMSVTGPSGVPIFTGKDISAFAMPGSNDYVICQNSLVSLYKQGRANAVWDSSVQGKCIGADTDFGASFVLIWTDHGDLFTYDNSVPTMGAKEWWQVVGVLLVLELITLAVLTWGKTLAASGSKGLVVIFAGAMAGLVVAVVFPNQTGVDWFGGELPVAVIVMASGAVAAYAAWGSGSGAWGVILGVIAGSITAALTGLVVMFLLWASGRQFGTQDAYFTALVNSVPIGFTASIAAGIVGLILAYVLVPGEKKKEARG